jgi:uncharacterized Zn-binding protein involved in type VI secretion
MHICPMVTVIVPHVGGPTIPPTSMTVLIGSLPAARITDRCVCVSPPDIIAIAECRNGFCPVFALLYLFDDVPL